MEIGRATPPFFTAYTTDKLNDIVLADGIQPYSVASFRLITN